MLEQLSRDPARFLAQIAAELSRRNSCLDTADLPELSQAACYAATSSLYATLAKACLARPLIRRGIAFDAADWESTGIQLYALWQRQRPQQIRARMAELQERHRDDWSKTFPDEWNIDEAKLLALYSAGPALLCNGLHALSDLSLALRYYVARTLAACIAPLGGQGAFDWGGSDGCCCMFLADCGAKDIHLFEPNHAARALGAWMAGELGYTERIAFHAGPQSRRYSVGICTEVLEHVVDPPGLIRELFERLVPGGVCFVTSSFAVPQDTHLKQNVKYAGLESQLMRDAGFEPWTAPTLPPCPFLPQWGFWRRPAG